MDYVEEFGEDEVSLASVMFNELCYRLSHCIVRDLVDEICKWAVERLVHFMSIFQNVSYHPFSNRTINGGLESGTA